MSTETHNGRWAYRLGRGAARARRSLARGERSTVAWLVAHGLPAHFTKAALWAVKLVVLGAVLYGMFWLALLLAFAFVAAWGACHLEWSDKDEPEWREGPSGFGLYDKSDWRYDMGDPYEP